MEIVNLPFRPNLPGRPLLASQTEFTRRIPTFRTPKQEQRDRKIITRLVQLFDIERKQETMLQYFVDNCKWLSNPVYWEVLRTVWVAAGSTETANTFRKLMQSQRRAKSWFMTVEDKAVFDNLPDEFKVWRAYDRIYESDEVVVYNPGMKPIDITTTLPDPGISWTLDYEWCKKYAEHKDRIIKCRWVRKADCFAYVSRRGEEEIIIL